MMEKKIISPNAIKKAIFEEGLRRKRKAELFEEVMKIEQELSKINEGSVGMAGSFGFAGDLSNETKTGFVDDQFQTGSISNIARLEREFAEQDERETMNEEAAEENKKLKAQIEELKKELQESKKSNKSEK